MSEHPEQPEYHDPSNVVNPEHADHHIVTPVTYAIVFASLLVGTAITVAAAYVDLKIFNPIVALAIACTKAVIVILFFMHVKYGTRLTKMIVLAGVYWLILLLFIVMMDLWTRNWMGVPGR